MRVVDAINWFADRWVLWMLLGIAWMVLLWVLLS